jgi:hypothetical protein
MMGQAQIIYRHNKKKSMRNQLLISFRKDNGQADAISFFKATEKLMWLNRRCLMPNVLYFIAEQYLAKRDGIYFGELYSL